MEFQMTNNIFTYATSELSQDAFLLYLFNYANTNTNEGKFARKLLNAFFKKNNKNNFINENNYNDFKIYSYKQFLKIDVLIVFINSKNKENSFCLVIEDKIKATESKENQLESYIKELRNEGIPELDINNKKINLDEILRDIILKNIIPIYFKNSFLQSYENNCKNIVDYLFGIEDIINIVGELDSFNDIIVKQWIEKIKQTENEIKVVKNFINKENDKTTLVDLSNLVSEKGYSAVNIANVLADFLFDGNSKKIRCF